MNFLYVLGGIALAIFGIWQSYKEIKIFSEGKQDELGADIKLLGVGITCIIAGIIVICQHI
jgi:hypothetical protein